jgi:hypothetical protein
MRGNIWEMMVMPRQQRFEKNNTMIVLGNLTDLSGMVASAMATFRHVGTDRGDAGQPGIRPRS